MLANPSLDRRTFIADLGRGAFALVVMSVAGCGPGGTPTTNSAANATGAASGSAGSASSGSSVPPAAAASGTATGGASSGGSSAGGAVSWTRVNLGFVSAYILARGGEAAIVDTGVAGSASHIEASLTGAGLSWSAVAHLILTHHHGDHQGSAADVLTKAPGAAAYAGKEDVASITVPRPLTAVADGQDVFGLRIVTTPGHTAGSISVLDPVGRILVAGDAMGTSGGKPSLPGAQFTVDMAEAKRSIVKLGALTFETLLVGHGDPITSGASPLVAQLGAAG
jgi:glyoxylase-like metal-dependent hydrolase (beta-lactamase superfamily II)